MKTETDVIEIEVDSDLNQHVHFLPLNKRVRGRFDYSRCREPEIKSNPPGPFPGQVIGFNRKTGATWIRDRLHESEFVAQRHYIERKNMSIPPERTDFGVQDVPTMLYWMRRLVDGGKARAVSGELPELDAIAGKPRKVFNRPERPENPLKTLMEKLVTVEFSKLPKEQRDEVAAMLN